MPAERLQKYLSRCGVASRRQAEAMIAAGRLSINGTPVRQPGMVVQPTDKVMVDGHLVKEPSQLIYYIFNKPKGVITTSTDAAGRQTVFDFLPKQPRVVACGRLDAASHGLIVLTNDGDFCYELTHPKHEHEKEYAVTATINRGPTLEARLKKLETGLVLDDGLTATTRISHVKRRDKVIEFHIVLHEGRNRQIRRMCSAVGLDVVDLMRLRIGKITLSKLPTGKWQHVKKEEIL